PLGVAAGIGTGVLAGLVNGTLVAKLKIPSFIATLGMLNVAKGLALVLSGLKPIYFNDTPAFNQAAMGSLVGFAIPGLDVPNMVLALFGAAAIAAAVIGGTSLSGGEGTILGTVIGAFIISTLTNGLRILSVPQEWQTVVTGGIVIVAVYLDIVRRRRQP